MVNERRFKSDRTKVKIRLAKRKMRTEIFVPRHFALVIIPVLMILWFVGTISLLNRIWEIQQEILALDREAAYLEIETDGLELEGKYYASEEYQELAARRLLNKQLPGETMVYLPENSLRAKTKYAVTAEPEETPEAVSNFEQWMSYLFGK